MNTKENKPTILVVDDNHQNIKLLLGILNTQSFNMAVALSGQDALEIMESTPIDLVLLDIMMPVMDGYETCKRMKSDEKLKDIPVIFVSALNDAENINNAYRVGGMDYLQKPVRDIELLFKVNLHLELASARKMMVNKDEIVSGDNYPDFLRVDNVNKLRFDLLPDLSPMSKWDMDGFILQNDNPRLNQGFYRFFEKNDKNVIIIGNNDPGHSLGLISDIMGATALNVISKNGISEDPEMALAFIKEAVSLPANSGHSNDPKLGILVIDRINNTLEYSSTGLPMLYYSNNSDSYEVVENTGKDPNTNREGYQIKFQQHDRIFLLTGNELKTEEIILQTIKQDLISQKESLKKEFKNQDFTLIGIEIMD